MPSDAVLPRGRFEWPAGDGHVLHVAEGGRAGGVPAMVLHGGPGSGGSAVLLNGMDLDRYHVLMPDQRGAGASRPAGSTAYNTTTHLVRDTIALRRERFGAAPALLCGGSWGATLAVAVAAADPTGVSGLLLRSPFLARREDVLRFFDGAPFGPPGADRLVWLRDRFHSDDIAGQVATARAWWAWECAKTGAAGPEPDAARLAALVDRYRVQSHYLAHDCFLGEEPLLERCRRLAGVPVCIVQGGADRVCPPAGARALSAALPEATLQVVPDAGHDPTHAGMASAMTGALDRFATQRRFDA